MNKGESMKIEIIERECIDAKYVSDLTLGKKYLTEDLHFKDLCKALNDKKDWEIYRKSYFNPVGIEATNELIFDAVQKPSHYADKQIEVIEYISDTLTSEQFEGYCIGNVLKYVSRYTKKNGVEDLKKAVWYLNRVIKFKEDKSDIK